MASFEPNPTGSNMGVGWLTKCQHRPKEASRRGVFDPAGAGLKEEVGEMDLALLGTVLNVAHTPWRHAV